VEINKQSFYWSGVPVWFWIGVPLGILITTTLALNGISSPSDIRVLCGVISLSLNVYSSWWYLQTLIGTIFRVINETRNNG